MSSVLPAHILEDANRPRRLTDSFRCFQRGRQLTLSTCLDDFMNANALRVKSMVCFECSQGGMNRETFAADADTEGLLDAELWSKLLPDAREGEE
jgi:hypothetical protein